MGPDRRVATLLLLLIASLARSTAVPTPVFSTPLQIFGSTVDVAEPIIACSGSNLWVLASGEGVIRACMDCPQWPQVLVHSTDSGVTWSGYSYVCGSQCSGISLQADPWLAASDNGTLYATFMNSLSIAFARSEDGGASWTPPKNISGPFGPADKDAVTVSDDNSILLVAFNANRYPYGSVSLDLGETWSGPIRMIPDPESYVDYEFFGNGGAVLSDGTLLSAQGGFYNPGNSSDQSKLAALHLYRSIDQGAHWTRTLDLAFTSAEYCPGWAGCLDPGQFFGPTITVAADSNDVVYSVSSAVQNGSAASDLTVRILFTSSQDRGLTWAPLVDLSTAPTGQYVYHGFPLVAAAGAGDVRVAWMDNRTGLWNVWYRASKDGGQSWSQEVLLSTDGGLNAPFHTADGFQWPYGDYGGMVIDQEGTTHVVWGEGWGWFRGGRVYYARSPPAASSSTQYSIYFYMTWILLAVAAGFGVLSLILLGIACRKQKRYELLE